MSENTKRGTVKPYVKPEIRYIGKVSELTRGSGSDTSDGWMSYTTIVVS